MRIVSLIFLMFLSCRQEDAELRPKKLLTLEDLKAIAQPYLDKQDEIKGIENTFTPFIALSLDSTTLNYSFQYDTLQRFKKVSGNNNLRFTLETNYTSKQASYNYIDGTDQHFLNSKGLVERSDLSTPKILGNRGIIYHFYKDGYLILSLNTNGDIQVLNEYNTEGNLVRRTNFTGNTFEEVMTYDYYNSLPNTIQQEIHQFTLLSPNFRNKELGGFNSNLIRNIYYQDLNGNETASVEFRYELDSKDRIEGMKIIQDRNAFEREFKFYYE